MSVSKIIPAGTGEKMQYLVHEYNDNTIRFVLRYPGVPEAGILCRAVRAVVESVDILHASFFCGEAEAYWQVNSAVEDGAFFSLEETEGDCVAVALERAARPVPAQGSAQLRCTLVAGREESALAVTMSHLCVDGVDGRYLLEKLAEAYRLLLETASTDGLRIKNGDRAAEQVYEGLSRREVAGLMRNPMSGIRSAFPYPGREPGEARLTVRRIGADIMARAHRRAGEQGATVNDVLLAACYHAYGAMPGVDKAGAMSVLSMMDLRRHCKNGGAQGLCNMTGTLSTQLPAGLGETFERTVEQIAVQTRAAKADPLAGLTGMPLLHSLTRKLPMKLLLRVSGRVYGGFSIGLTNLGSLSGEKLALGHLLPTEGYFGGPMKKKPAMQLSVCSLDGACALCAAGEYTAEDGALLGEMMEQMARELRAYADD